MVGYLVVRTRGHVLQPAGRERLLEAFGHVAAWGSAFDLVVGGDASRGAVGLAGIFGRQVAVDAAEAPHPRCPLVL